MDITALTTSRYATQDYGPLRCVGRFNNAINFLSPNDRLLTLHREGRGLSPMGWEIGDDDFDEIFDSLPVAQHCQLSPTGIELEDIAIYREGRGVDLCLKVNGEIALSPLAVALANVDAQTGLFGRLDSLVERPHCLEIRELQQHFTAWLLGQKVDWSAVLGKGPGLTPSNDDTVLGMLLVAHLDSRVGVAKLPSFFAASQPLSQLTTLVSVHYLQFAVQGIFSTPVQLLARALVRPKELPAAINGMLATGHFSGADTLLGAWLGIMAINRLY